MTWFEANIRKLGVIESLTSQNSCIIRTSRGQKIKRMISSLTPVLCARINRYLIKNSNNALDHFTLNCQPTYSYANVFQSGLLGMVDFTVFLLPPSFSKSNSFLSYCEIWTMIVSVPKQRTEYFVTYMIKFCLMLILNGNKEFHLFTVKLEQYNIIILLFQSNFFLYNFYLIFLCYIFILFPVVHFIGLLASDYLTNLCDCCFISWVMIVCKEIFVYLQTIWQGCVGMSKPFYECSISLWAGCVPVLILMLVYLQLWWGWVMTLWAKIGRDIGKLLNLKLFFLQFWEKSTL